jgi:hypothetical protein
MDLIAEDMEGERRPALMLRRVAPARAERVRANNEGVLRTVRLSSPAKWNPPGLDNDQEDGGPTIQLPAAEPAAPFVSPSWNQYTR